MVKFSEAEKNIAAQQDKLMAAQAQSGPLRLYVGNLHQHVSEQNLQEIFSAFGAVDSVQLHKDPVTGQPKGFAFVNYRNAQDGRMAMDQLNGYEIAGMAIKVGLVNETPNAGQGGDDALDDGEQAGMQQRSRASMLKRGWAQARNRDSLHIQQALSSPGMKEATVDVTAAWIAVEMESR